MAEAASRDDDGLVDPQQPGIMVQPHHLGDAQWQFTTLTTQHHPDRLVGLGEVEELAWHVLEVAVRGQLLTVG